ncbi:MarR family transcriptional regulator [uncultured Sphaerochaeta sp.]|uniref:MarR family winged helix-turn-helix transcriptional regulator n=1 Tax=uncultured Sphaerochaeta sp. TaxID=886478 RepID=UPI002AA88E07|nr:MarR family transcriptional regulator [uncultured Sphaerochaeta sp.]
MSDDEMKANVFGSLFLVANRLQVLGDQIDAQISTKQWLLLAVLLSCENQRCSLTELSKRTGSSRQNIKKMALILEKRGFLKLTRSDEDKRTVLLQPTQACLSHLKTREGDERAFVDAFFADFDTEMIMVMQKSITQWMKNLGRMEDTYGKEE